MINQIYLSVLFRAKSVKENIYKSLLTLSTCAHTTAHTAHSHTRWHIRNDHKIQTKQLPRSKKNNNNKERAKEQRGSRTKTTMRSRSKLNVLQQTSSVPRATAREEEKTTTTVEAGGSEGVGVAYLENVFRFDIKNIAKRTWSKHKSHLNTNGV